MIASQHYAMLEHGTVYLIYYFDDIDKYNNNEIVFHHNKPSFENAMDFLISNYSEDKEDLNTKDYDYIASKAFVKYHNNPYSKVTPFCIEKTVVLNKDNFIIGNNGLSITAEKIKADTKVKSRLGGIAVTTNFRVLVENDWLEDLKYLCEPTEFHKKRVTVRFVTSNGIAREFTRHRVFSFAQESTRYCNYTNQAKFGNELTYIHNSDEINIEQKDVYERIERCYKNLIASGMKPQMARDILPLALKTELVMTGFVSDWNHFFDLRARGTTGAPHPDVKALVEPLMCEFKKRDWL